MLQRFLSIQSVVSAVLVMAACLQPAAAQDGKPNVAFGEAQLVIQLPPNPGVPFTCANLQESLVASDGSGKLSPVEGPTKTGPNNCAAKFKVPVGKQYQIAVKPTGVACPAGKKLNFELSWLGGPSFTLMQPGAKLTRIGQVTAIACQPLLP